MSQAQQMPAAEAAQTQTSAVSVVPPIPVIERDFYDKAEAFAWNLLLAIIIYVVGHWLAKILTGFIRRALARQRTDTTILTFVCNIVYGFMMVVVLLTAADRIGLPTTSLVAIIGASTLAIGMALRDSLANFAAGVLLVVFRYYKVGDSIEVAGAAGKVDEIQIFSTVLTAAGDVRMIVPNGNILKAPIRNLSAVPVSGLEIAVKVDYRTNVGSVKALLLQILRAEPDCLDTPEPSVELRNIGGGALEFVVRCWVQSANSWKVLTRLNERIKAELDSAQVIVK